MSWSPALRQHLSQIACTSAEHLTASQTQQEAARRLAEPNCQVVVTGQQPVIGGGPLYSLIKTAQAVALATELGEDWIPVFWCASEDHDTGEADHADLIQPDGRIQRVRCQFSTPSASSRFQPATAGWEDLLPACQGLRGRLGSSWLQQHAPQHNEALGTWCCRLMLALFADRPLVCLQAHELRPLWQEQAEWIHAHWPRQALAEHRQHLLAAGRNDPFAGELAAPPWFADEATGRRAITHPNQATAEQLSTGAALRPIIQQLCLPASHAILGPGERAYHDFIEPLYPALQAQLPQFIARQHRQLVPGWLQRACQRWGLEPEQLRADSEKPDLDPAIDLSALDAVLDQLAQPDHPSLKTGLPKLRRERHRLAASLTRHRRRELDRPAFGTLRAQLFPRGKPQERVMSLFQAVWEHGPGLAECLINHLSDPLAGPNLKLA